MGELFSSFVDSWEHFLVRAEPLRSFFDQFRDEPADAMLLGWLVPLDPSLRAGAAHLQAALAQLDWLRPVPDHFLHVWIATVAYPADPSAAHVELDRGRRALGGSRPFALRYPRLNCFPTAVVAEAEAEGLFALHERLFPARDRSTFLPHATLAVPAREGPAADLRHVLAPLRETDLGGQQVRRATLCLVPATRASMFRPWVEVGEAPLAA